MNYWFIPQIKNNENDFPLQDMYVSMSLTLQHQAILEPAMVHPGPQLPGQEKIKAAGHTQRMEE